MTLYGQLAHLVDLRISGFREVDSAGRVSAVKLHGSVGAGLVRGACRPLSLSRLAMPTCRYSASDGEFSSP